MYGGRNSQSRASYQDGTSPADRATQNSRSRSQTNQSRAVSQRNRDDNALSRGPSRTSRASGISRTPSAERALLQRLSETPEVQENDYDGATGNESQASYKQTRQSKTKTPSVNQTSRVSIRETPQAESHGKGTRQSRRETVTDDNGVSETPRTDEDTTQYYETTEDLTTRRASDTGTGTGRRSERKAVAGSSTGAIRLPDISAQQVDENDWRRGKTVADTNSYLLKYEVACDTTCVVDETREEVRCHRYMLMARSPLMFTLLQTNRTNIRIEMPDIKKDIFRDVIQYIYSDVFDVHTDNVTGLLYAAKRLQLRSLTDICFRFLDGEVRDNTVARIMETAHEYDEIPLYEKCLRYIFNRGSYVLKEKDVEKLCASCLERIIKSNDLRADEGIVYEGALMWANAECLRKKLPPSDDYRRKMLGEMLYLIRFPIMNKTFFSQRVSGTELLTQDEKLSVFQHFHGSDLQMLSKFNSDERNWSPTSKKNYNAGLDAQQQVREPIKMGQVGDVKYDVTDENLSVVRRFHTSDGSWRQNGPDDAITFLTSIPIILRGVEVFGTSAGSEGYRIKLAVFDELRRAEVRKSEVSIFTESKLRTYDLQFDPVRIPARQPFTVVVSMKGAPTHKGVDGETTRDVDGVQFEFKSSNKSPNGSDVTVGQIPGLLFSKENSI